jgi:hypothetical protein
MGKGSRRERLTYLRTPQIRQEIVYASGGDPTRYTDTDLCLNKADLKRIAQQLQPDTDTTTISDAGVRYLLETVCEWAGAEYQSNAGNQWRICRDSLKAIHRAVNARPQTEMPV